MQRWHKYYVGYAAEVVLVKASVRDLQARRREFCGPGWRLNFGRVYTAFGEVDREGGRPVGVVGGSSSPFLARQGG